MPKQTIAIDCDDVLVDFNGSFIRYHNRRYGTNISYRDIFTHDMTAVYECEMEEVLRRVDDFYRSPEHTVMQSMPGAAELLPVLAARYELHIVTSRASSRRQETEVSIALHFPEVFSDIHFTNAFGGNTDSVKRTKSEVCRAINAKLLVEDAPHHAAEVAAVGIPVIMPDRPWNQGMLPPHVIRAFSWDEAADIITQYLG